MYVCGNKGDKNAHSAVSNDYLFISHKRQIIYMNIKGTREYSSSRSYFYLILLSVEWIND